jgi:hypothetical protein
MMLFQRCFEPVGPDYDVQTTRGALLPRYVAAA